MIFSADFEDGQLKFSVNIHMPYAHLVFGLFCLSVYMLRVLHILFLPFVLTTEHLFFVSLCPFVHSILFFCVLLLMDVVIHVLTKYSFSVLLSIWSLCFSVVCVCVCACVWLCVCLIWRDQLISIYTITHNHQGYRNQ